LRDLFLFPEFHQASIALMDIDPDRLRDTELVAPEMQTRAELYETIGYFDYEELDSQIARSTLPQWPPADTSHGGQQG
ncbi:hypothetical protein, partial [Streptococcus pneumoniae]|uniref:hypothetical protein n=1 Tax=Streptococcus pneumoniae TaxID=1313 RepID=UPI001258C568